MKIKYFRKVPAQEKHFKARVKKEYVTLNKLQLNSFWVKYYFWKTKRKKKATSNNRYKKFNSIFHHLA